MRIDCRIAGRTLRHEAPAGSLAICPAGLDCGADAEESVDALLVAIDPGQLALAAAEDSALEAQLNERLSGYDQALLDLARTLALESASDYPNGPLYWNEVAGGFIDGLVARHTSGFESRERGMLGKDVLVRLRDYVDAHLDEPIEVAALAAAESLALEAQLNEHLRGYDQALLDLARALASESAADYPNGPLYWNEVASGFIDGLVARHTSGVASQARGMLGKDVLGRLRDYVVAHLDEPIEVAALAGIAGRSPSHFSHVFTRSVGRTPHRWVVHLRLQCAIELVREGRSGLAEIAARTGFADQSHLSRWVRRVHGVSLTQLVA